MAKQQSEKILLDKIVDVKGSTSDQILDSLRSKGLQVIFCCKCGTTLLLGLCRPILAYANKQVLCQYFTKIRSPPIFVFLRSWM